MKPDQVSVAITLENGGLAVMSFVTAEYYANGKPIWTREPTPKNIEEVIRKSEMHYPAKARSFRPISPSEIPQDRTYRGAWRDTGTAIDHDMEKARLIHMDLIRAYRDAELAKLDTAYMIADEKGDQKLKMEIALKKQALRDLPGTFDLSTATTIEELKLLWPTTLPTRVTAR